MEGKIEIRLQEKDYEDSTGMAIFMKKGGKTFIAKPIEFEELKEGYRVTPLLEVSRDHNIIQQLKENLRRMGYLNNADEATNNALKYHLEDMRSLVFKEKKR